MKINLQKKFLILFCILIFVLYLLCIYFYPKTRDEFYYLVNDHSTVIAEFSNSYFNVNARIGQFFSNLSGRSMLANLITSGLMFVNFFYLSFLTVFRTFPTANSLNLKKSIIISGLFIFLINYFGEMFFYVPYSTNYTLTNVFYLLYIFVIIEYFIYNRDLFSLYKIPVWLIIVFGIFTGMGNEHVPPALLLLTGLLFLSFIIKNKKILLPSKKISFAFISVIIGYFILFFAPANRVRFKKEGKQEFGFNIADYFGNLKLISKIYYYYNFELLIFLGIISTVVILLFVRRKIEKSLIFELLSYIFLALVCIFITAYSPIIGTRLLFFSNVLFILSGFIILFRNNHSFFTSSTKTNLATILVGLFVGTYFISAFMISKNANENYCKVMTEIENKAKSSKNVIIEKSFDYQMSIFGKLNRKVLLDTGESYIDTDNKSNTPVEKNIIYFFKINTIKSEK
ncbi:DUF6056 family protein [Chryseobacterium sp. C-71]|uniref:DUF6056 family protein n=1 Tax=Chryseobacterium sp. C-71 TaxID=2893882 RepID=UPI001E2B591F|nr:DUF6056 family protein [Chryseobacterium sp. C-71]UFH30853.1 DUF6056 family protein [Chryseobacterium sp. C-71]